MRREYMKSMEVGTGGTRMMLRAKPREGDFVFFDSFAQKKSREWYCSLRQAVGVIALIIYCTVQYSSCGLRFALLTFSLSRIQKEYDVDT